MAQKLKRPPTMRETWVQSLGWEDPLEKEMATHCSIIAWRIPWMEEPGWLESSFTFPICVPFISFSSLIAVARTSKTMLNKSGKSGHPCLIPDLRGNAFSFSLLRMMFAVDLLYMTVIMLRYVPCMPT